MNSSKDVRQSRSRPSRLSCQGRSGAADDITALLMGKNKVVAEMARKVMKKLEEEVQRNGLKLSVTEDGKEGKSKMIAVVWLPGE